MDQFLELQREPAPFWSPSILRWGGSVIDTVGTRQPLSERLLDDLRPPTIRCTDR